MEISPALELVGAALGHQLHDQIGALIDGNHVDRSELTVAQRRCCEAHIVYDVDWTFESRVETFRRHGNAAVSQHFGYDQAAYQSETAHRCEVGRTHQPLREPFMAEIAAGGGAGLARADQAAKVWDFGQHSVHERCSSCSGNGEVSCSGCYGSGRTSCYHCHGAGSTTQTRWISRPNGGGHSETYQQPCYTCGSSGRVSCSGCGGSGRITCSACSGHGFFTDVANVTVRAVPRMHITVRSRLSNEALLAHLVRTSAAGAAHYFEFAPCDRRQPDAQTWRVVYETHTAVVELDLALRSKTYLAAAAGPRVLAFVRPAIFDDLFVEEIADLQKVFAGKKPSLQSRRARQFFETYAGQPVLDEAMKSVAKLRGNDRQSPGREVVRACDGYITAQASALLGRCMLALLDKVSPPHSVWSWFAVMLAPMALVALAAQNWMENHGPRLGWELALVALGWSVGGMLVATAASPVAALVSTVVSAVRRRAVPPAYRQHGRNWQPFGAFAWGFVGVALAGGTLGWLAHEGHVPRLDNLPVRALEETLALPSYPAYMQAAEVWRRAGLFVTPNSVDPARMKEQLMVLDIQTNLRRLGYGIAVSGQLDNATRQQAAVYAQKRRINRDLRVVHSALCKERGSVCRIEPALR